MDSKYFPLIIIAGIIAGFINTLAGSGSAVSVSMMIFLGIPSHIANGTNRVAILLQNIIGVKQFSKNNLLDKKGTVTLGTPAVFGSIVGSMLAASFGKQEMDIAIGYVMILMLFVILLKPKKWLEGNLKAMENTPNFWQYIMMFFIGVYGGFIQIGVGIFLLSGLVLSFGYDLVRANAVKVGIVLFFTIFSLTIFIYNKQVDWQVGLLLALGNMTGAWLGTKLAIDKGAIWVRRLLIIVVLFAASKSFGLISF
jgi:uncharacterized protein